MKNPSKKRSPRKPRGASTGKEYVIIAYLFVGIFLSLIGYMIYFNISLRDEINNSPYNRRQEANQKKIIRGDILSADGEILATTETDSEGNEVRKYPFDRVFAHVVGYSGGGRSGLELEENYRLMESHSDPVEQVKNELQNTKNKGDTLKTTLNAKLQKTAYDALGKHNGAIIVMEPSTGKILVNVSKPDFNPNTLSEDWDEIMADENNSSLVNRGFTGLYPPGSTFKIVTALAYLNQKHTLDDFSYNCSGEIKTGNFTLHCSNGKAHGEEDFAEAFAKSCNSAFASMTLDLDADQFNRTTERLLFNQELDLPLPAKKSRFSLDGSTADALAMQTGIGQGNTLVTPMYMAMLTSAIANDGRLMKPYLVDSVISADKMVVKTTKPTLYRQVLTNAEAEQMTELMKGVVENGTAKALKKLDVEIAGKTGSAEHGDLSEPPHSWFVGFSNPENPELVVSIVVESAGSGSEVAVPIAKKLFEAYYN